MGWSAIGNWFKDQAEEIKDFFVSPFKWPGENESSSDFYKKAKQAKEAGMTVEEYEQMAAAMAEKAKEAMTGAPANNFGPQLPEYEEAKAAIEKAKQAKEAEQPAKATEPTKEPEYSDAYKEYLNYTDKFESGYKTALDGTDETRALDAQAKEYYGLQDEYIKKYIDRGEFAYDVNTDKMYAMYRDQYLNDAKLAQQDATAQAAGLTGGYGSSYASSMGNQAYDSVMRRFDDKSEELYENAYNRYLNEGQAMLDAAALYGQQADNASSRSQGIKQQMLTDAAAAGEYANYMYQKSPEYESEVASAANDETLAGIVKKLEGGAKVSLGYGSEYSIDDYGDDEDDVHTLQTIADSSDFYGDLIEGEGAVALGSLDAVYDEIIDRLKDTYVGAAPLTEEEKHAIAGYMLNQWSGQLAAMGITE